MNKLAKWMMRLYPARWRARYGDEMNALLADTGADARVVTDLFRGGIRMQFATWSFPKLALALGLIGLMLGLAGSYLMANEFRSRATLRIMPAQGSLEPNAIKLYDVVPQLEGEVQPTFALGDYNRSPVTVVCRRAPG